MSRTRSPSSVTVAFAPTATFDVSLNDFAASAPVNVTTPSPIVTASNVAPMSALIVAFPLRDEKSMSSPAFGATLLSQLPADDILPSPAKPVQKMPDGLPTKRTSVLPSTAQEYSSALSVSAGTSLPCTSETAMPVFSRIRYTPVAKPPFFVIDAVPLSGSVRPATAIGATPVSSLMWNSAPPSNATSASVTWFVPGTVSVAPSFTVTARAIESPALTTVVPASHTSGAEAVWLRVIVNVPAPADVTAPAPPKLAFSVTLLPFLSMTNPPSPAVNHFASSDGATMLASPRNTYRVPPPKRALTVCVFPRT